MAEFLIYNKNHWTTSAKLTSEQVTKFKGCYKKGDVVEVRPDGYWDKRGFNKEVFTVIKKEGMKIEEAEKYMEPLLKVLSIEEEAVHTIQPMIAKRKYQIMNEVIADNKILSVNTLSITTKTEVNF